MAVRPGDRCTVKGCDGALWVYCTRIYFVAKKRIRYLCCKKCGHCPEDNIWSLPLDNAPARTKPESNGHHAQA